MYCYMHSDHKYNTHKQSSCSLNIPDFVFFFASWNAERARPLDRRLPLGYLELSVLRRMLLHNMNTGALDQCLDRCLIQ